MADLEIIDAHIHLFKSAEQGREFSTYFLQRGPRTGYPAEPPCYGTLAEVLQLMKETGVTHSNVLNFTWSGKYYQHGLYTLPDEPDRRAQAETELRRRIVNKIRENNEWALSVVGENKNLSFFCGIDPVVMDEETLLGEIEDKTKHGALGVKMVPSDLMIGGNDRRLWPVYDYCQSGGIPFWTQVAGQPGALASPVSFGEALKQFPRLKIAFSHLGYGPSLGQGADAEVVEVANANENVFTDLSLRLFPDVATGRVTPEDMVSHFRRIGVDRVIYASNFPVGEMLHPELQEEGKESPRATSTKKALEIFKTLPLGEDEREKIASKNFKRLVGLKG